MLCTTFYSHKVQDVSSRDAPVVLIYGAPRLWCQALHSVLETTFQVYTIREYSPPELPLEFYILTPSDWFIVFLPTQDELYRLFARVSHDASRTNWLLLSMSGDAIVREADRIETTRQDISLNELLEILRASPKAGLQQTPA